jgi:hypothetical protein
VIDNENESDCSSIMKLVKKAWAEPERVNEFYNCVQQKNAVASIRVMLKSCIAIQYYFLCGPHEVLEPNGNLNITQNVLTLLYNKWITGYKSTLRQTMEVKY